ncbi:hypothetical protein [Streptacidiphilus rugosus]|uniref:hypothetical protein n=1 Tax=Streptacidiphilus rugosus TaxID=405783 RepID=UPI00056325A9|nr:hypothetical protein [Streptacidiphilus rugosus]
MNTRIWGYRPDAGRRRTVGLAGFHVEAVDGGIGRVVETGKQETGEYLVVDTGPWILGRHVVLPAGAVALVDAARRTVFVDRTRQQIKDAPPADFVLGSGHGDFERLGRYYGTFYASGKT